MGRTFWSHQSRHACNIFKSIYFNIFFKSLAHDLLYMCFVKGLTHWDQVTHICVSKLTIICSDNGLSPSRRQAVIWTNAGILLIGPLGTNFSEILIKIDKFSFKKMHFKMSSGKWRPFCLDLNVLTMFGRVLLTLTAIILSRRALWFRGLQRRPHSPYFAFHFLWKKSWKLNSASFRAFTDIT